MLLAYAIAKYLHILAAIIGAGGAFASDVIFFKSHEDKKISQDEFSIITVMSHVVWLSLGLLVVTGAFMFGIRYEALIQSSGFLAKATIVLVVVINGVFFHYLHIPYIKKHLNHHLFPKNQKDTSDFFVFSGVLSMVSWLTIITISSLKTILPFNYLEYLGIYCAALSIGSVCAYFVMRHKIHEKEQRTLKRAAVVTLVLALVCGGVLVSKSYFAGVKAEVAQEIKNELPSANEIVYSLAEVSNHNTNDNCWVIVDNLVFDVTKAASHSGAFHCGADVSVNYHKNHGAVIRPQMLVFKIGALETQSGENKKDEQTKESKIAPSFEQIAKKLQYNAKDLMFIVEKNNASFLVVDGSDHEVLGRFHGIGFQPHGIVYSADEKFAYSISRDGWLIKINITKLEAVSWVKVGESSRGIALSDDGKIVVAGNYEPGDAVVVKTDDMSIVNRVKLEKFVDGKTESSRAGVIVEDGNQFIVALKDLNGVWILDPSNESDMVVKKYWNVGGSPSLLHDGFLTPDGKYFMVAAQDANNVWVLDVATGKAVTNVPTGVKPHTGPGAYAYNTVYVPSLGEGKITAIEYGTWKVKKYIETAGPGLFARSYNKNPKYPYVWADTAFFDGADEIYVIDSRTQKIAKTLVPVDGKLSIHPEFTYDGKFVYVASSGGNMMVVYDANTFEEVTRFEAFEPSGIFNVGTRIEEPGL